MSVMAGSRGKWLVGKASGGLHALFGDRTPGCFGILVYHRVAPISPGTAPPSLNVTSAQFERQLGGLQQRGYQFVSLQKALAAHERGAPLPARSVVVTFDDGFGSVASEAWPILRSLQIPATVFVNTAFLDTDEPFPFDAWGQQQRARVPSTSYRPLTTEQCRAMIADGLIALGTHTHAHADFRAKPDALEDDLRHSASILRERFALETIPFAFPYGRRYLGYVSEPLIEAARRAGVTCALTTEAAPVDGRADPFTWGRFNVYDEDTAATLAAKLGGWYGWAPRLQEWLAPRRVPQPAAAEVMP